MTWDAPDRLALGWHVISGEQLLEALRCVAAGEDPDILFAQLWANAKHEQVEDNEDNETERTDKP